MQIKKIITKSGYAPTGTVAATHQNYGFHLVTKSPWPILMSFSLLNLAIGAVLSMHGFNHGGSVISLGLIITIFGMGLWFRDIVMEGTFLGDHTKRVKSGITIGFLLFIISEAFAFFSVFWSFFHSALSPSVEIGGIWPPFGLTTLNSFGLPLTNTVLLLSSGAYVTLAHHALIGRKRKTSLDGSFVTLILAILFTLYQGIEYSEASFSFSDSVFGTVFFASTGLHGLTILQAPTNNINKSSIFKTSLLQFFRTNPYTSLKVIGGTHKYYSKLVNTTAAEQRSTTFQVAASNEQWKAEYDAAQHPFIKIKKESLQLIRLRAKGNKRKAIFYLNTNFLKWLSGFTDAEGNFNISLRNFKDNKYNSVIITFQIGLHINDLPILKLIQTKLNCGHISISGNKCNYFVNDQNSLIDIILPIFNHVQLNSSKYYQFLVFEKAISLIKDKKHLSSEGKLEIIKYYNEMKNSNLISRARNKEDIKISDYWLGGFTDGDACFNISTSGPRLKFENHEKELELLQSIKEYLKSGNLNIIAPRKNLTNSNPTVTLEINNIHVLKNLIVPLYNKNDSNIFTQSLLLTKKYLDFCDWSISVCIFFYGYHRFPEGISLINKIRSKMNNFRFITKDFTVSDFTIKELASLEPLQGRAEVYDFNASRKFFFECEGEAISSGYDLEKFKEVFDTDLFKQDPHLPLVLNNFIKNVPHYKSEVDSITILDKLYYIFSLPSPYEIKDRVRFLRGTAKLVSEKLKIIAIDKNNNRFTYSSITECSKALNLGRTNIKNCILSGQTYKTYKFILANES